MTRLYTATSTLLRRSFRDATTSRRTRRCLSLVQECDTTAPAGKDSRTTSCSSAASTSTALPTTTATATATTTPPSYSVRRRILPAHLTALHSPTGRQHLLQALQEETAEPYWLLTEHFCNQSDPAYCGVTTLTMVLNAFSIDPVLRWKGGWRYFANEDVVLHHCCLSPEHVRAVGITLEQFRQLAVCQGLQVQMERPTAVTSTTTTTTNDDDDDDNRHLFRQHLLESMIPVTTPNPDEATATNTTTTTNTIVVVSYSRAALGQTGDGHFSPVAAYHRPTDQVLLLDVARFKYPPYWVAVDQLYHAMKDTDPATAQSRGWCRLKAPNSSLQHSQQSHGEARRPVGWVPLVGHGPPPCPVHDTKVDFCRARPGKDDD